jgi:hypothetical protein
MNRLIWTRSEFEALVNWRGWVMTILVRWWELQHALYCIYNSHLTSVFVHATHVCQFVKRSDMPELFDVGTTQITKIKYRLLKSLPHHFNPTVATNLPGYTELCNLQRCIWKSAPEINMKFLTKGLIYHATMVIAVLTLLFQHYHVFYLS